MNFAALFIVVVIVLFVVWICFAEDFEHIGKVINSKYKTIKTRMEDKNDV